MKQLKDYSYSKLKKVLKREWMKDIDGRRWPFLEITYESYSNYIKRGLQ